MKTVELSRAAFQTWLESKDDDADVGIPAVSSSCPIATYLKDKGIEHPLVGMKLLTCVHKGEELLESFDLDPWAREFVRVFDNITLGVGEATLMRPFALRALDDTDPTDPSCLVIHVPEEDTNAK